MPGPSIVVGVEAHQVAVVETGAAHLSHRQHRSMHVVPQALHADGPLPRDER